MQLKDRVVVVMGAGASGPGWGNGKASALAYAQAGASVVCVDYSARRASEAADEIRAKGFVAHPLSGDATKEEDVRAVTDWATTELGRIDVWHNNVGLGGTVGPPEKISPEKWDKEIAQNLTSAYLGIRCAAPVMREQGGGSILNVSSLLSQRFLRQPSVAYTASKAAVEALTRACAAAYGRDSIRVNCLRIGFSETPVVLRGLEARQLTDEQQEAELNKSRAKVPLRGEHTDPFDVAAAAVFLASDAARAITGVILDVDGGLMCAPI
jgi:NAD(P)-dependent dehydrogenase (short-subunit alcohol dehydrogenase family)